MPTQGRMSARQLLLTLDMPTPRTFRASRAQRSYVEAWLDPQAPKTISGICRHLGLPRRTVYNWLADDQGFVTWFNHGVERNTDGLWQPILLKVAQLAVQGSIEHARLFAQVRGALRQLEQSALSNITVLVGIPRPGAADPSRR
jgi:hypothetical protein